MNVSIKTKIIIWFTLFFTALTFAIILFLQSISSSVIISEVEDDLMNLTSDVVEDLVILPDGPFYAEELEELEDFEDLEPFQYFKDNVSFAIYENNVLVYGQLPIQITSIPDIRLQSFHYIDTATERFVMYDVIIDSTHVLRAIQNITTSDNVVGGVINQLLIVTPIIILIAGLGGFFILKTSFQPIQKLYIVAESIKNSQDFSKRMPMPRAKDEIYKLSDMMNQMLHTIEETFQREKQFSSNVSHELRTPLSVLKAQIEYLETKLTTDIQKNEMEDIQKQIHYVEQLVDQILYFTRNETLNPQAFSEVDVYQTIQAVIETYEDFAQQKNIHIQLDGLESITIFADELSIIRIMNNILSNAIKYNKDDGEINIHIVQDKEYVEITCLDTGIGIQPDELLKIKQPFYRVDTSRTIDSLSLGIGLSMVDRLVTMHHGSLEISSEYGIYTKVKVLLPIKNTP